MDKKTPTMVETFVITEAPLPRFQQLAAQARSRRMELYMVFTHGMVSALPVSDPENEISGDIEEYARAPGYGWALVEVPDPDSDGFDWKKNKPWPGQVADAVEDAAEQGRDPADEVVRRLGGRVIYRHDAPAGN